MEFSLSNKTGPGHLIGLNKILNILAQKKLPMKTKIDVFSWYYRQQVDYGIFIVEQDGSGAFNRAMLLNVGAAEALKSYDFQCFIFHDVDLLPEDDRNLYTCPVQPRHMSVAINKWVNILLFWVFFLKILILSNCADWYSRRKLIYASILFLSKRKRQQLN